MKPEKINELMILGFLDQRIMQAENDLAMYGAMKEEVLALLKTGQALDRNNKFLRLVTNQETNELA